MIMKDPHHVTYNELITSTEERLSWMKKVYPAEVRMGKRNEWHARHQIAIEKAKLKLFKKFQREPQTNLFDAFTKMSS